MEWLNYHHLFYFWTVVREGGIARAAKRLRLAHATVSAQIKQLETALDADLFERQGRRLRLTGDGEMAFRYAEEIFTLGREFMDSMRGRPIAKRLRVDVGVTESLPKAIAHRLLQPALSLPEAQLRCIESGLESLLGQLAIHRLDVVLADAPIPEGTNLKAYNHRIGHCGVCWLGTKTLARRFRRAFPQSLDNAPVLLPIQGQPLRRELEAWLDRTNVSPNVVAEFSDSALLKTFGENGLGLFAVPTATAEEVKGKYGVVEVGRTEDVQQHFYAISPERRIVHPAVKAICSAARESLFDAGADE